MYKLIYFCLAVFFTEIHAGYDLHGLDGLHGDPYIEPALIKSPIIQAPTIVKEIAPAPAPIYAHAAPLIKAIAPPATSYATVTQVHVTHPAPIVKAVVAPPPVIKTLTIPAPIPIAAHAYPHYSHYPH